MTSGRRVCGERLTRADQNQELLEHLAQLPFVPVRVVSELVGRASPSSVNRRLRALQQRGLVRAARVPSGGTRGGRPLALWRLTPDGEALLGRPGRPGPAERLPRQWLRLIATYDMLGALAAGLSAEGGSVTLQAWEAPWQRVVSMGSCVRSLQLPGAAVLASSGSEAEPRLSVLLLPDLGWAPVALHRRTLASLVALRAAFEGDVFPTLVVATRATPGRLDAWRELIRRVAAERGEVPLQPLVVAWSEVCERRLRVALDSGAGRGRPTQVPRVLAQVAGHMAVRPRPAVTRAHAEPGVEQAVLQLVGRHPFLPIAHLAVLLGVRVRAARARLQRLAAAGLMRWVGTRDDREQLSLGLARDELAALELSELTREGLRELAAMLGLSLARAERLHGLVGGGPEQPTRTRRLLLRALAHTLGTDAVFVAVQLAVAGPQGDGLTRWDNAAACQRGRCRPDGYGVCRLGQREVGFFLEYDRGTERARDYAAKWAAYYAYRDRGRAAEDYTSFPTILVVTSGSEEPVIRSARAAAIGRPTGGLPILVTTTGWLAGHREGLLGPIWRAPSYPARRRWLGDSKVAGTPVPRLVWPTVAQGLAHARPLTTARDNQCSGED